MRVAGKEVRFDSPNDALDQGIATVFQDLAVVPIMPVYRNFFLGREPSIGWGPFRRFDVRRALAIAENELSDLGVSAGAVRRAARDAFRRATAERRRGAGRPLRRAHSHSR